VALGVTFAQTGSIPMPAFGRIAGLPSTATLADNHWAGGSGLPNSAGGNHGTEATLAQTQAEAWWRDTAGFGFAGGGLWVWDEAAGRPVVVASE